MGKVIIQGSGQDPLVWWHWQNLAKQYGHSSAQWWRSSRFWLHWPGNCLGVQWVLFPRECGAQIEFSDTSDHALSGYIKLPFFIALYWSIDHAAWAKRLPGVRWQKGNYQDGERELLLCYSLREGFLHWKLWRSPNEGRSRDWRDGFWRPSDTFLGYRKYSEVERGVYPATICLPEADYPVTVRMFTSIWKRPRWPWPQSVDRVNIEIKSEKGVPLPAEDDAIFSSTFPAKTIEEALTKFRENILRQRANPREREW